LLSPPLSIVARRERVGERERVRERVGERERERVGERERRERADAAVGRESRQPWTAAIGNDLKIIINSSKKNYKYKYYQYMYYLNY